MVSRLLSRTVSLLLVAILATLASANVLCLLPCEVAAAPDQTSSAALDHCGGTLPASSEDPAIAARADSCAGQHAWNGPTADRTIPRTSVDVAIAVTSTAAGIVTLTRSSDQWKRGALGDPPGQSAHTSTPLRI